MVICCWTKIPAPLTVLDFSCFKIPKCRHSPFFFRKHQNWDPFRILCRTWSMQKKITLELQSLTYKLCLKHFLLCGTQNKVMLSTLNKHDFDENFEDLLSCSNIFDECFVLFCFYITTTAIIFNWKATLQGLSLFQFWGIQTA